MPRVFITEFAAGTDSRGGLEDDTAFGAPLADHGVAIGAGNVQSAAFNANTERVRIHTDAVCSIAIGANPVASATTMRLAANETFWLRVNKGSGLKVGVITNT